MSAAVAALPAGRAVRPHRACGVQAAQERLLCAEQLGGLAGGVVELSNRRDHFLMRWSLTWRRG
ncbi:hypothetical protein [Nonomuraea africana]|uniref:Uncharacterized protein n=1 Tax=Nonomuraea africana TaxID=46171 RepID=A0ABR9K6E6_9ACTN|nr:hypothetical protein [Nonomuraea africana]MBE1557370.1 hypothetical protein [Nonomuraea africana]